jgi:DNA anti-recombination protein RmuC
MTISEHSTEQRQRMIAEAAYFRAEQRGFQGGDPVDDWLQAEAEIDQLELGGGQPARARLADQIAAQLREWDGQVSTLAAKARDLSSTVRAELERELERLKPLRTTAGQALDDMRQRAGQATDDLRALSEKVRSELADGLENLARRLR